MRVMITGGGTGGHTSPAVAILEELRRRDPRLLARWVGRRGAIEERIAKAQGIPFRALPVEGWPRARKWRRPWVALKLALSVVRAVFLLRAFEPDVVISVGGYVSLPLAWAAQRTGRRTVLHEQNKRLGMANRMLAARATRIFLSFEDTLGTFPKDRAQVVGNPVRAGFVHPLEQAEARERLGLAADTPVVLVCGGSQGARSINQALAEALPRFEPGELQIIWAAGRGQEAEEARKAAAGSPAAVQVHDFIEDMAAACAAADLVVGRSGASTTAELAVLGRPALLIPYPHAADNHQEENARAWESAGAGQVLLDRDLSGPRLEGAIRGMLCDPEGLGNAARAARELGRPLAAETIAEAVMLLAFDGTRAEGHTPSAPE